MNSCSVHYTRNNHLIPYDLQKLNAVIKVKQLYHMQLNIRLYKSTQFLYFPSVFAYCYQIIPPSKPLHPSKTLPGLCYSLSELAHVTILYPTSLSWLPHLSFLYFASLQLADGEQAAPRLRDVPDGQRGVSGIPPVLGGADVHAPQLPAVPMGRVLITLHLKVVLLDVVYGGKNDPSPIFLNS